MTELSRDLGTPATDVTPGSHEDIQLPPHGREPVSGVPDFTRDTDLTEVGEALLEKGAPDSPAALDHPVEKIETEQASGHKRIKAIGAGVLAMVVAAGLFVAKTASSHESSAPQRPTAAGSTPNPGATVGSASASASTLPSESAPTTVKPGTIDLVTVPDDAGSMAFANGSIEFPVGVDPTKDPAGAANSFLSAYAFYLYNTSSDADNTRALSSISDVPSVLNDLQQSREQYRQQVGLTREMPEFWDDASDPAQFTKSTDSSGNTVVTLSGGTIYFNSYYAVGQAITWQNPKGHDETRAAKVSNFSLTYAPALQQANSYPDVVAYTIGYDQ